jgi:hypothetical protein
VVGGSEGESKLFRLAASGILFRQYCHHFVDSFAIYVARQRNLNHHMSDGLHYVWHAFFLP